MTVSKTALACALLALALMASVAGNALVYSWLDTARGKLLTERIAHNATRSGYARDKGLWLMEQRAANATIAGLQRQVNATGAAFAAYREESAERAAILREDIPRLRTQEEKEKVVSHETRRRAARLLNAW